MVKVTQPRKAPLNPHLLHLLLINLIPCGGVDGVRAKPQAGRGGVFQLSLTARQHSVGVAPLVGLVEEDGNFTRWLSPLASTPAPDCADWMATDAATVYPRNLRQLTLPGTHDSGSFPTLNPKP